MSTNKSTVPERKLSAHATGAHHSRPQQGQAWVVNSGARPYRVRFIDAGRPGGPRKARFYDVDTNKTVLRLNGPTGATWPGVAVLHELLRLSDPHADMGDLPRLDKMVWLVNVTPSGFTLGLDATGITVWPWRLPLPADAADAARVAKKLMRAMSDPAGPDAALLAQEMNS